MSISTAHQVDHAGPGAPDQATGRWLPVQQAVVVAIVLTFIALQAIVIRSIVPPFVVVMVLFLIAGFVSLKRPRAGSITIGVLSLLALVAFVPDIVRDLGDPASAFTFVLTGLATVAVLVGTVVGFLVVTRRVAPTARRRLPLAAGLAVVALVATATVARVALDPAATQPGDILVVAEDVAFVPESLEVAPGPVSVHLDNRDLMPHNFTSDELGVALHVPERASARVEFEAPTGTYTVFCTFPGHEEMTATLVVG